MSLDIGDLSIRIGPLYALKDGLCFHRGEGGFEPTMKHTSERRAMAMERSNGWREQRQLFQPARSINPDQLTVSHYYIDNTLRSSRHCLDVKSRNMGDVQEVRQVLENSRESIYVLKCPTSN